MVRFFDYETVADEAGVSSDELDALRQRVRSDHPADEMMYELRLFRTCLAIRDGACTVADALKGEDRSTRREGLR